MTTLQPYMPEFPAGRSVDQGCRLGCRHLPDLPDAAQDGRAAALPGRDDQEPAGASREQPYGTPGGKGGDLLSVPATRQSRHDGGRWETVRYALDSNARTFRLCLILLVTAISPVAAAVVAVLIHHVLLWPPSG